MIAVLLLASAACSVFYRLMIVITSCSFLDDVLKPCDAVQMCMCKFALKSVASCLSMIIAHECSLVVHAVHGHALVCNMLYK